MGQFYLLFWLTLLTTELVCPQMILSVCLWVCKDSLAFHSLCLRACQWYYGCLCHAALFFL